jgi:hypothetical protein
MNQRLAHIALVVDDVIFIREPSAEPYGTVAVFQDLYGNLWDLIQPLKMIPTSSPVL